MGNQTEAHVDRKPSNKEPLDYKQWLLPAHRAPASGHRAEYVTEKSISFEATAEVGQPGNWLHLGIPAMPEDAEHNEHSPARRRRIRRQPYLASSAEAAGRREASNSSAGAAPATSLAGGFAELRNLLEGSRDGDFEERQDPAALWNHVERGGPDELIFCFFVAKKSMLMMKNTLLVNYPRLKEK